MWGDVDPAGIAYYPRLVVALNQAGEAFMEQRNLRYWELPERYGVHFPVVAMGAEFEAPVLVGDTVSVRVEPELGTTSFTLNFEATHEDGTVSFRGHERHVCVDVEAAESVEIPAEIRDGIGGE